MLGIPADDRFQIYTPHEADELVFDDGCCVELDARWGVASVTHGDRRMTVELADGIWTLDFRQRHAGRRGNDGTVEIENAALISPYDELMLQLSAFLEAVRTRSAPKVTSEDGHAALSLAHRIREQILSGLP